MALSRLVMAVRGAVTPGTPGIMQRLAAVPRMVGASLRGEYAGMTRWRMLGLVCALVYVVSPIDLLPEGLLSVVGLADDAAVIAWMAAVLVAGTEDFLHWERGGQTVRSHVVG
ncbi:MAG: YkvA family protein [Dermatophilaceae bacterium]